MAKKKVKKTPKQYITKGIFITLALLLVIFILSVTEPGSKVWQSFLDGRTQKSWAPGFQWRIAKTHAFLGRPYLAAQAFLKYYTIYPKVNEERTYEAQYQEMANLRDSEQYETCLRKVEEYLEKYEASYETQHPGITPWYEKAKSLMQGLRMIPASKLYDHVVY